MDFVLKCKWCTEVHNLQESCEEFKERKDNMEVLEYKISGDGSSAISNNIKWIPIDGTTPRGKKVQLINQSAGVATCGMLNKVDHFWTHWCPLPTFTK